MMLVLFCLLAGFSGLPEVSLTDLDRFPRYELAIKQYNLACRDLDLIKPLVKPFGDSWNYSMWMGPWEWLHANEDLTEALYRRWATYRAWDLLTNANYSNSPSYWRVDCWQDGEIKRLNELVKLKDLIGWEAYLTGTMPQVGVIKVE
jgi:hypothetical protein